MAVPSDWLLYGANGYTGRLIAAEAVRRGARPVLAGRSAEKIESLARALDCPARIFPLDDPSRIGSHLAGVRAVLHGAGPFSATAGPMREACLRAGVHYLDLTGEIDVIEAAAAQHERAVAAGVCLLPAVGFDVVPSDCLAAMLARRLSGACRLELAFVFTGSMSPGTAKTTVEAIPRGGRVRIGGRIEHVPTAWKTLEVPFPGGTRWAMTVPWGDVASAWHTTGIPDIEVYVAVPPGQIRWIRRARPLLGVVGWAPVRRVAQWWIRCFLSGPSPQALDQSTAAFWGRVTDGQGRHVEATLQTPGGYPLTVWAALASLERVLAGGVAPGFATPAKAFGPEFILEHPQAELRWL
jgi:short subunit dehydrogenase-like uncharacterized protein